MPPKTKHFIADHRLEAVYKTQRNYHYGYAKRSSANSQANDEPAESFLFNRPDPFRYEEGYIQKA